MELGRAALASDTFQRTIERAQDLDGGAALQANALLGLGNVRLAGGELEAAIAAYRKAEEYAPNPQERARALNNLAEAHARRARRYRSRAQAAREVNEASQARSAQRQAERAHEAAQDAIRGAIAAAPAGAAKLKARLTALALLEDQSAREVASAITELPPGIDKARAWLTLARQVEGQPERQYLQQAADLAEHLGSDRLRSETMGTLGRWYEQAGQPERALAATQQALDLAPAPAAPELRFRWQWQLARLQLARGQRQAALTNYGLAADTLDRFRSRIVAAERDVRLQISERIEPFYKQLIGQLLAADRTEQAIGYTQKWQLAEVQAFFDSPCAQIAEIEARQAPMQAEAGEAIYRVVLVPERAYGILSLPNGEHHVAALANDLEARAVRWRRGLQDRLTEQYRSGARDLYADLLAPFEAQLAEASFERLTYIGDGKLRNIPLGALHDGERFAIERFPITNALGIQLPEPERSGRGGLLGFGLSVARNGSAPLPYVPDELKQVQALVGGQTFLNETFSAERLATELKRSDPQYLHLASHADFAGVREASFLQAYDGRLSLSKLEDVLERSSPPPELLVLSACETAASSDRSTLGIAGVALRSGVDSAAATLWPAKDKAIADLVAEFYRGIEVGLPRTRALQQAKRQAIERGKHPALWAPMTLLGS